MHVILASTYEDRLIIQGNPQAQGLNYCEAFAQVVKLTTVRTLLAIIAELDLELKQMNVGTVFLNGDIKEQIYVTVPEGLRQDVVDNKV